MHHLSRPFWGCSTLKPTIPTLVTVFSRCLTTTQRRYATNDTLPNNNARPGSNRRAVTIANDDGRVRWSELSVGEKAARTTQQSFNLGIIALGVVMTGGVAYFLFTDVFSLDSKTSHFNRAVKRIREDPRCLEILGDSKTIRAFGEASWNRWTRNRHIASTVSKDKMGVDHMLMHFNVEGPRNHGVVHMHMIKRPQDEWQYRYLYLDVQQQPRIWLENADKDHNDQRASGKMFGVRWW
ncbi:hypothetical protein LTS18_007851 [Coniosporium uncinatum]|uniref:Uncharacterized protein n=1 Tax=Coniosporium uncinatum TaxID=93489 RepID=A0ACC3DZR9_9PEZI|nr:hypothetical protein LTS18_007851 [Coniosporium uncinatum]